MSNFDNWLWSISFLWLFLLSGCQPLFPQDSNPNSSQSSQLLSRQQVTTVDVAIAKSQNSTEPQYYIGTAEPNSTTILRSQLEGRLLELSVSVGDWVDKNQIIGRLDDSLLSATLEQERAELASLESELATEELNVKNTQINLQEAKIRLEQAENDAQRYTDLAKIGAISQQQAESFQTAAKIANQAVFLGREEVEIARQTVTTAKGRIARQKATIAEVVQRQTYSQLIAPATGIVIAKNQEPGNLIRPGEDIITIGDLSRIKIIVPISAVDLDLVEIGQKVKLEFDAFSDRIFQGKVNKIAPTANENTRKVTIEIIVINSDYDIKSGLLARVQLPRKNRQQVIIPLSAMTEESGNNYIFKIAKEDSKQRQAIAVKERVLIDDLSSQGAIIKQGLQPGEKYILRSSQPLQDGQSVNLSILSE